MPPAGGPGQPARRGERGEAEQPLAFDVGAHADRAVRLDHALRHVALAGARKTVRDRQRRVGTADECSGERQVSRRAGAAAGRPALFFGDRRDLRAHQGPRHQVEAQRGQPVVVAARLQAGIDEAEGQRALPVGEQVPSRGRRCRAARRSSAVRRRTRCRRRRPVPRPLQHVGKMQVAVALAHATGASALLPERRQCVQLARQPRAGSSAEARAWRAASPSIGRRVTRSWAAAVPNGLSGGAIAAT